MAWGTGAKVAVIGGGAALLGVGAYAVDEALRKTSSSTTPTSTSGTTPTAASSTTLGFGTPYVALARVHVRPRGLRGYFTVSVGTVNTLVGASSLPSITAQGNGSEYLYIPIVVGNPNGSPVVCSVVGYVWESGNDTFYPGLGHTASTTGHLTGAAGSSSPLQFTVPANGSSNSLNNGGGVRLVSEGALSSGVTGAQGVYVVLSATMNGTAVPGSPYAIWSNAFLDVTQSLSFNLGTPSAQLAQRRR